MKKIVALLLVSCFAIFNIGCGKSASNNNWTCPNCGTINGGNYCSNCGLAKPSDDFENSRATNEKDDSASTESDNENDSDWLNSAYEDRNAYEIFSGYTLNNADTKNIVAKLNNNENSFVRFLYDEYEALDYENMTDLERDFFDNYWRCYFSFSFKANSIKILNSYIIGYDDNGRINSNISEEKDRRIILNIDVSGEDDQLYRNQYIVFWTRTKDRSNTIWNGDADGDIYYKQYTNTWDELKELFGTDFSGEKGMTGNNSPSLGKAAEYIKYDPDKLDNVIQKKQFFISTVLTYRDTAYKSLSDDEAQEKRAEQAEKNADPEVGMTKIQVLNGGWGEPSKKNVTQIGRITHEQWVYPNDRYVYFDDGIVTTVQKSE